MVCKDCVNNKSFGKRCWFYWEGKKKCSQFRKTFEEEPGFKEVE